MTQGAASTLEERTDAKEGNVNSIASDWRQPSIDSENSDWAAPEIRALPPEGTGNSRLAQPGEGRIIHVRWMWEDEAVMPSLARMNPRRWNTWQHPEDAVVSLEQLLGTNSAERPLRVEVGCELGPPGSSKITSARNVSEAIVFIYKSMALQNGDHCDTTTESIHPLTSGPLSTLSTLATLSAIAMDDTTLNASRGAAVMRSVARRATRTFRNIGFIPKLSQRRSIDRPSASPALSQIVEEPVDRMLQETPLFDAATGPAIRELAELASPCGTQTNVSSGQSPLSPSMTDSLSLSSTGLTSIMLNDTARVMVSYEQTEPIAVEINPHCGQLGCTSSTATVAVSPHHFQCTQTVTASVAEIDRSHTRSVASNLTVPMDKSIGLTGSNVSNLSNQTIDPTLDNEVLDVTNKFDHTRPVISMLESMASSGTRHSSPFAGHSRTGCLNAFPADATARQVNPSQLCYQIGREASLQAMPMSPNLRIPSPRQTLRGIVQDMQQQEQNVPSVQQLSHGRNQSLRQDVAFDAYPGNPPRQVHQGNPAQAGAAIGPQPVVPGPAAVPAV